MNPSKLIPKLLIGVMIISAPIFAAIRAAAIGVDLAEAWTYYAPVEIVSGALLVLMEGGALYVVSSYWRQFKPFTVYWNILAGIMGLIAFAIPFIATSYFVSAQFDQPIYEVLTWNHILINHLTWIWSFSVACIPTILVIGLGIAHGVEHELPAIKEEKQADTGQLEAEAWGIMAMGRKEGRWIYPPELVQKMGNRITVHQAVQFASAWHKATNTRPGVKSLEEKEFEKEISLNGIG
jgi:hypothetical protein